jgi:hypothetical protein
MRESILLKYDVRSEAELEEFLFDGAFEEAKLYRSRMGVRLLRRKHLGKIAEWASDSIEHHSVQPVLMSLPKWSAQSSWLENLRHFESQVSLGLGQVFQARSVYEMHFALSGLDLLLSDWEDYVLKSDLDLLEAPVHSREELQTAEAIQFLLKGEEANALNLLRKEKTRLSAFIK